MSVIEVSLGVLCLSFLMSLVRAAIGPTLADRAAATDVCLYCVVGALALMGVRAQSSVFVDAMLVATLLGFIATVALARLLDRSDSRKDERP